MIAGKFSAENLAPAIVDGGAMFGEFANNWPVNLHNETFTIAEIILHDNSVIRF